LTLTSSKARCEAGLEPYIREAARPCRARDQFTGSSVVNAEPVDDDGGRAGEVGLEGTGFGRLGTADRLDRGGLDVQRAGVGGQCDDRFWVAATHDARDVDGSFVVELDGRVSVEDVLAVDVQRHRCRLG